MATKRQSRKQRIRQIQTEAILQAAEEVFAAKGYHNAKMEDIAAKAEFSAGSLYNYFKCKEDIFTAIFVRKMDMLYHRIERALTQGVGSPPEASEPRDASAAPQSTRWFLDLLGRLLGVYVRFMDENRDFFRLFLSFQAGPHLVGPMPAGKAWGERYERFRLLIEGLFALGMEQGLFHALDPRTVAETIMAAMNATMVLWLRDSPDSHFSDRLPGVLRLLLFGIANFSPEDVPDEFWHMEPSTPLVEPPPRRPSQVIKEILEAARRHRIEDLVEETET